MFRGILNVRTFLVSLLESLPESDDNIVHSVEIISLKVSNLVGFSRNKRVGKVNRIKSNLCPSPLFVSFNILMVCTKNTN